MESILTVEPLISDLGISSFSGQPNLWAVDLFPSEIISYLGSCRENNAQRNSHRHLVIGSWSRQATRQCLTQTLFTAFSARNSLYPTLAYPVPRDNRPCEQWIFSALKSFLNSVFDAKIVRSATLVAAWCLDLDRVRQQDVWRYHYLRLSWYVICRSARRARIAIASDDMTTIDATAFYGFLCT